MTNKFERLGGFSPKRKLRSIISKYDKFQEWFNAHGFEIDVHEYRFADLETAMKCYAETGRIEIKKPLWQ